MSILKIVPKKIHAFAGNTFMAIGIKAVNVRRTTACMLLIILLGLVSQLGIGSPISDEINEATDNLAVLKSTAASAAGEVSAFVERYKLTNAGKCALLVVGTSSSNSTSLYFIPGPVPVTGLSGNIISGSSVTITGLMTGPEADQVGKTVTSVAIAGGRRFLVVGFNQNALVPGDIAMVMLDTSQASPGPHILALTDFSASSREGNDVPLCVTTGVITK